MSPLIVEKVNHVGLTVGDLDAAEAFFCDMLGFRRSERVLQFGEAVDRITGVAGARIRMSFVRHGDFVVELMEYEEPAGRRAFDLRPCDVGHPHIALEVPDIHAAYAAVQAAGYTAVSEPQMVPYGPRRGGFNIYVRGPDRIIVELQQRPAVE